MARNLLTLFIFLAAHGAAKKRLRCGVGRDINGRQLNSDKTYIYGRDSCKEIC